MKIWIGFEPRDLWVGLYWTKNTYDHEIDDERNLKRIPKVTIYMYYICIIPMFPITIRWERKSALFMGVE